MVESITTKWALQFRNAFDQLRANLGYVRTIHFDCQRRLVSGLAASELRDLTYREDIR